jgi:SRSO17 transposase
MCNGAVTPETLEDYLGLFRGEFRRRDQAQWAAVYLQGLLRPGGRKNVESLARSVTLPDGLLVEDVAQALQHFINQSPWDEGRLWRRYQALRAQEAPGDGLFVFEEMGFVKQGRHSVGVQRQFSRALGRKTNCQLAVAVHHVSAAGCAPLGLRLYLPRGWLSDPARLDAAGVPQECRAPASKLELALGLLDSARSAGALGRGVAPGPGWLFGEDLRSAVAARGLECAAELPADWARAVAESGRHLQEGLGLEHFEGRSWRGFHHHACLVILAHGHLARRGALS